MNSIIAAVFLLLGSLFILIAAVGLVRFKDLYSRIHATTKASSFGILLLLVGICMHFANWNIVLKSLLVIVFVYLTAPLAAHAVSKAFKSKR